LVASAAWTHNGRSNVHSKEASARTEHAAPLSCPRGEEKGKKKRGTVIPPCQKKVGETIYWGGGNLPGSSPRMREEKKTLAKKRW